MKLVIAISFLIFSSYANAQFLKEGTVTSTANNAISDYFGGGKSARGSIYVVPNEINPEAARSILSSAADGVYLSVGAERGLLGVLMAPNATHLLQIDLVPEVVMYNQLNVVLLKISKDRADFLFLREAKSQSVWLERLERHRLSSAEKSLITNSKYFEFYRMAEGAARDRLTNPDFFVGSSYLKDDALFMKAKKMADEGRIQVIQGNLMDSSLLTSVSNQLSDRGLKLSVVDLSNAWEPKYVGPDGVDKIVEALKPALKSRTLFMGTSVAQCIETHLCRWDFRAFTFKTLQLSRYAMGVGAPISRLFNMTKTVAPNKIFGNFALAKLSLFTPARNSCLDIWKN